MEKLPKLLKKDIEHVEEVTRQQAANLLWHESRIGHITASSFHEINVKAKKLAIVKEVNFSKTLSKIFGFGPNLNDLCAIKYGVAMEPEAKIKYKEVLNGMHHTDIDCGIFLHSEFCFISATPDLVVQRSCCGLGIVEIKCPQTIADKKT